MTILCTRHYVKKEDAMIILSTNQCLQNSSIFKTLSYHIIFKNATTVSFRNPALTQTLSYHLRSTSVPRSTNGTESNECSVTVCMSWEKPILRFVQYINILCRCHRPAEHSISGSVPQKNTIQKLFHGWCMVYIKEEHYQAKITNGGVRGDWLLY